MVMNVERCVCEMWKRSQRGARMHIQNLTLHCRNPLDIVNNLGMKKHCFHIFLGKLFTR